MRRAGRGPGFSASPGRADGAEDNKNAIALYKKIGFEIEGLMRDAMKVDGVYENTYLMALLF